MLLRFDHVFFLHVWEVHQYSIDMDVSPQEEIDEAFRSDVVEAPGDQVSTPPFITSTLPGM